MFSFLIENGEPIIDHAYLFSGASIDVIEIGTGGADVFLAFTDHVASAEGMDVQTFKGSSPEETPNAMRFSTYDLVFIDGNHMENAVQSDFKGVYPFLSPVCIVAFHDLYIPIVRKNVDAILDMFPEFSICRWSGRHFRNPYGTAFIYRGFDVNGDFCAQF